MFVTKSREWFGLWLKRLSKEHHRSVVALFQSIRRSPSKWCCNKESATHRSDIEHCTFTQIYVAQRFQSIFVRLFFVCVDLDENYQYDGIRTQTQSALQSAVYIYHRWCGFLTNLAFFYTNSGVDRWFFGSRYISTVLKLDKKCYFKRKKTTTTQ